MMENTTKTAKARNEEQYINLVDEWVSHYRSFTTKGRNAAYIPALEKANASHLGICIIGPDGTMIKSGNWDVTFTLQSISKVISFIAVCLNYGIPYVLERVDLEPTGDPFNSIVRLEINKPGKPFNPMINTGAITVSSLLPGDTAHDKLEPICLLMEKMIGKRPTFNEEVFQSEWQTAYRNKAIAYYLKETGFLEGDAELALEVYLKHCSIEVNTEDIALIGLVLAYDGYHPIRKEQVLPKELARIAKSLMLTCGIYNASGKFAAFIGLPAKSGVSGGIMASVPNRVRTEASPFMEGCGIGIYGPAVDEYGSSVAGLMLLKQIANSWDLSIF